MSRTTKIAIRVVELHRSGDNPSSLLEQLEAPLQKLAWYVAGRYGLLVRYDGDPLPVGPAAGIDTDGVQEVLRRLLYGTGPSAFDPSRGSFLTWAKFVLRTWLLNRLRSRDILDCDLPPQLVDPDEPPVTFLEAQPAPTGPPSLIEDYELPPSDLHRAERWGPPLHRVVLLAISGLCVLVPPSVWQRWLHEAQIIPPFPSPDQWYLGLGYGKIRSLARDLGVADNTLSVIWNRKKHLLTELAIVRDMLPCPSVTM